MPFTLVPSLLSEVILKGQTQLNHFRFAMFWHFKVIGNVTNRFFGIGFPINIPVIWKHFEFIGESDYAYVAAMLGCSGRNTMTTCLHLPVSPGMGIKIMTVVSCYVPVLPSPTTTAESLPESTPSISEEMSTGETRCCNKVAINALFMTTSFTITVHISEM